MSGNSIADSSAVSLPKVLAQHQAAHGALGEVIETLKPQERLDWLDAACGKGQILVNLNEPVPELETRGRIYFFGYDISNDHVREAVKRAHDLQFGGAEIEIGNLENFSKLVPANRQFSFITLTNTAHELKPAIFSALLLNLILRLKPGGTLFVYDMETLHPPELGAIPWGINEIRKLLELISKALDPIAVPPRAQPWQHSTCKGWSFKLNRDRFKIDDVTFTAKLSAIEEEAAVLVKTLFEEKLQRTIEALEELQIHGEQTAEEQALKTNLLYDFWSLSQLNPRES